MNISSVTFKNGRITKLIKFLNTITKSKGKYSSSEGNLVIIVGNNVILFKLLSNGLSSLYEYFIQIGEDLILSGYEQEKVFVVNVHDFMKIIVHKDAETEVKMIEYDDVLKFKSHSKVVDSIRLTTQIQLFAIDEPDFAFKVNDSELFYEAKISKLACGELDKIFKRNGLKNEVVQIKKKENELKFAIGNKKMTIPIANNSSIRNTTSYFSFNLNYLSLFISSNYQDADYAIFKCYMAGKLMQISFKDEKNSVKNVLTTICQVSDE